MEKKIVGAIFVTLFCASIIASAKAIVDVAVLKEKNKNNHALLLEAKSERILIRGDIKDILDKI